MICFFISDDVGSWFYHCDFSFRQKRVLSSCLFGFGMLGLREDEWNLHSLSSTSFGISSLVVIHTFEFLFHSLHFSLWNIYYYLLQSSRYHPYSSKCHFSSLELIVSLLQHFIPPFLFSIWNTSNDENMGHSLYTSCWSN